MKKTVVISLLIFVMLVSVVAIAQDQGFLGSYSSVQRRFYDPFNREVFFGEDYVKPLEGYGLKGASAGGAIGKYGAKGTGNVGNPLAYASVSRYGRNPGSISNFMSSVRGHDIVDAKVFLESPTYAYVIQNGVTTVPKGFARIVSNMAETISVPIGTVTLEVADLPPLDAEEVWEAWLVDEESGYHMSLGIFVTSTVTLGRLYYEITYNLEPFDTIIVTREFFPDLDPGPNGEVVLIGRIE